MGWRWKWFWQRQLICVSCNGSVVVVLFVVVLTLLLVKTTFGTSIPEGFYCVGTGSTGVAECLAVFGGKIMMSTTKHTHTHTHTQHIYPLQSGAYMAIICASALAFRVAPTNYSPSGWTRPASNTSSVNTYVGIDNLMKTPQFWLMFTSFAALASAGCSMLIHVVCAFGVCFHIHCEFANQDLLFLLSRVT
jgi:hypothetical protein